MLTVSNLEEYSELLNSRRLVVIAFVDGDQTGNELVGAIKKFETEHPCVVFAQVNVAHSEAIAIEHNIKATPVAIFYNNTREVARKTDSKGAQQAVVELAAVEEGACAKSSKVFPKSVNKEIDQQQLELFNVGSTGKDLFTTGDTTTITDADDQLLAFIPFRNKVSVQGLHIKTCDSGNRPTHIKVFASLVTPLSFEDAAAHKAQLDKELPEPDAEGWIDVKVLVVNFKNVSSLLILLTGEDEDEPISIERIEVVGKAIEQASGSIHDEHQH